MLARGNRLTRGSDYRSIVRGGSRCVGPRTVTYVVATAEDRSPRFGFIVSKQVGNAVTRNTVRRRLKAVCADVLPGVRPGADVIIRALPSAATANVTELRDEITRCLTRKAVA